VRILSIVHQDDAGAGVFGEAAAAAGHDLDEWRPPDSAAPELDAFGAVIVFGGAMHVDQEDRHPWLRTEKDLLRAALGDGVPVLGVCLGSQLLAEAAGARPRRAERPEIGWVQVELTPEGESDPLLGPLPRSFDAFQWHSYEFPLPPGATPLARSSLCLQGYRLDGASWGIQFHAEVALSSVKSWLEGYARDPDAVLARVDEATVRAETEQRIEAWNALGRGLCRSFLAEAERQARRD
jgi:GMP synthase (glutamine-hydrolysing)